jgi:dihydropyrimidine dehydrogenase (NAD+) subunit PreA
MKNKSATRNFTLWSLEEASEFDYNRYAKDIDEAKDLVKDDGLIIASIAGSSEEEWEGLCKLINDTKADMCELNISCPYASEMGIRVGAAAVELAPRIARIARKQLTMPFSAKLSVYYTSNPITLIQSVKEANADAVTFPARTSGLMIDIEKGKPAAWGAIGGYGGPYLIGHGLGWVARAASRVDIPILGTCGVWDWEDIVSYLMVGATAVEVGTAIMIRGYTAIGTWLKQIESFMKRRGYTSIQEMKGVALKNMVTTDHILRSQPNVHATIRSAKCTKCGNCLKSCFYDAITLRNTGAIVDTKKCDGCGMCIEVCPFDAAEFINHTN